MLKVECARKHYGSRVVLRNVSFSLNAGRTTALVGPNGSGKTTLLHAIVGLVTLSGGVITIDGNISTTDVARQMVGFSPDDLPMPELLTGREYLNLIVRVRRVGWNVQIVEQMAKGMRLLDQLDSLIATYSHGMKRKLQLIASVLHRPRLLILDEPFRGLDPESSSIMCELVARYSVSGSAVLFSTHDLPLAQRLCNDIVVISDGTVSAAGTIEDVIGKHSDLEELFLHRTGLGALASGSAQVFFEGLERLPTYG